MALLPHGAMHASQPVQQRNAASEALLGAANGVVVGGALGLGVSAAMTAMREGGGMVFKTPIRTHLGPVLVGAAGLGVVNALVRHGQAEPYNRWAEAHNAQLAEDSHAARLEARQARSGDRERG